MHSLTTQQATALGEAVHGLWQLPAIKATYQKRGVLFSLEDNMDYWFNKGKQVMAEDYQPSDEDILKTRVRTAGVAKYEFEKSGVRFMLVDIGGQRNERKKWLYQFDEVTAVIWVTALNHYNSVLFEDESRNAMHDAIEAFDMYVNRVEFYDSEIILFLNKSDLFTECIENKISLSVCFSKEAGWCVYVCIIRSVYCILS